MTGPCTKLCKQVEFAAALSVAASTVTPASVDPPVPAVEPPLPALEPPRPALEPAAHVLAPAPEEPPVELGPVSSVPPHAPRVLQATVKATTPAVRRTPQVYRLGKDGGRVTAPCPPILKACTSP